MTNCSKLVATLLLTIAAASALAQDGTAAADHEALRKLKGELEQSVSRRDFGLLGRLVHQPFMATVVTQDSFADLGAIKSYYDGLFTRSTLRMKDVSIKAEADELSRLYTGTVAMTRGSTLEHYELADGRAFDMKGRWTAVSIKEPDGSWKLLGIHMGTNFLDNPVLSAIERSVMWTAAVGAGLGLLVGFGGGWLIWRRRVPR
jgi:ketosteroid isomerase-like protein